jgi:hypothetical protein
VMDLWRLKFSPKSNGLLGLSSPIPRSPNQL